MDAYRDVTREPIPVDFWDSKTQQASVTIDQKAISLAVLMKWIASPNKVAVAKDSPLEPLASYFRPEATPQADRIVTIRVHRAAGYIRGNMRLAHLDIFSNHQGYVIWRNLAYVRCVFFSSSLQVKTEICALQDHTSTRMTGTVSVKP